MDGGGPRGPDPLLDLKFGLTPTLENFVATSALEILSRDLGVKLAPLRP